MRHAAALASSDRRLTFAVTDETLLATCASLLYANGQTTERAVTAAERVAEVLGQRVTIIPHWGELIISYPQETSAHNAIVTVAPTGIDMGKVAATIEAVDDLCEGRIDRDTALTTLQAVARRPPVSLARFALLGAAGAAALGVIFGATQPLALLLIAISTAAGACLRRWLAGISHNIFVQPLAAAFLAGLIGAFAARLPLGSSLQLVAVCPCMVLVPGAHLLNGAIDLIRARVALGASRLLFAATVILAICIGLLVGLAVGGTSLPPAGATSAVPFIYDVLSAGVAVAAFGTFFAMPWRMLPIPVAIGMLAHASRWVAMAVFGTSIQTGALVACLLVGTIVTPIADRLRLPFAGFAFASVVSLIPGVYLFRMAGGLVAVAALGEHAPPQLLLATIADGSTAMLVLMAMTIGLIVPRMCIRPRGVRLP